MNPNDNMPSDSPTSPSADQATANAGDFGIIAYFANNSVAANLVMGLLLIGAISGSV